MNQNPEMHEGNKDFIMERSVYSDKNCFAINCYENKNPKIPKSQLAATNCDITTTNLVNTSLITNNIEPLTKHEHSDMKQMFRE